MRAAGWTIITCLSLSASSFAWEVGESHEDSYEEPSTERSWPPRRSTTTRPPPRRTEDQERSSNDDSTNQIADRIFDKLMNAAHGDASLVLSGLEIRFNVRVNVNASPEDRLSSVVSAVTACLPSYGFSSYRPIIYAVGDRLLEELQKGVEFSVNVRLPGQGGTGGRLSSTTTTTTTTTRPSSGGRWWGAGESRNSGLQSDSNGRLPTTGGRLSGTSSSRLSALNSNRGGSRRPFGRNIETENRRELIDLITFLSYGPFWGTMLPSAS